jgi:hypothetical protein
VVEYETEVERAQLELARIGFDQVMGFISADDLDETLQITQIGPRDFLASMESPQRPLVVHVRSAQEWSDDHLEGAIHLPLPRLLRKIGGIPRNQPVWCTWPVSLTKQHGMIPKRMGVRLKPCPSPCHPWLEKYLWDEWRLIIPYPTGRLFRGTLSQALRATLLHG